MRTITLETTAGDEIAFTCAFACRIAKSQHCRVRIDFNDFVLEATPNKSPVTLVWEYNLQCDRARYAWNKANPDPSAPSDTKQTEAA